MFKLCNSSLITILPLDGFLFDRFSVNFNVSLGPWRNEVLFRPEDQESVF